MASSPPQLRRDQGHDHDEDEAHSFTSEVDDQTLQIEHEDGPESYIQRGIFISHTLATWNSRMFEFGAVLFLSTIYPHTLLPASTYALVRSLAAVVFSSYVGKLVDRRSRIVVVRASIVGQRLSVIISCALFYVLQFTHSATSLMPVALIATLSILGCVEKLSATMNTIAIERDWVVTIAGGSTETLQAMNSTMRRIDLTCKLVAPLIVAFVHGWSARAGILFTLATALISVPLEYLLIVRVYVSCADLRKSPVTAITSPPLKARGWLASFSSGFVRALQTITSDIKYYTTHPAFLPSVSLALLYLTVLSFGGQMVNYLVSRSLSSPSIGILRTVSALFELSATWIAPLLMKRIGAIRSGIWLLNWQLAFITIAAGTMWVQDSTFGGLWLFLPAVMLSRVGLWGFDLSAQCLVQELVEADGRGRFSAIEAGLQNLFELSAFATTILWDRPEDFKIPAAISAGATAGAAVLFTLYVRQERGHLFHPSKCLEKRGSRSSIVRGHGYSRVGSQEEHELAQGSR